MTYSAFIHSNTLHLLFIPFFHTPTHTKAAQSHNSGTCGQGCVQYKGTLMTWPIEYGQREKEKERKREYCSLLGRWKAEWRVWSQGHRWRAERAEKMCVCEGVWVGLMVLMTLISRIQIHTWTISSCLAVKQLWWNQWWYAVAYAGILWNITTIWNNCFVFESTI